MASTRAHAVDGVKLIDQAKALAGNVTVGDAPGFPVTLSKPGSYRLAGNLRVANPATHGIVITSPGVTLDLNGFELSGPNICTGGGLQLSCSLDGLPQSARGEGISLRTPLDSPMSVSVSNGSVRGFAGYGLRGHDGGYCGFVARRLLVSHNGYVGFYRTGTVSESVANRNGTHGLYDIGKAMDNYISYNRGSGIRSARARFNVSVSNGAADSAVEVID